ncbi:MAG: fibronectin type III domain-containing protein, partial [Nitrososphaera sp.]|nr:fibronectin type III domain-containing protein [Nitrososphaera sp.]
MTYSSFVGRRPGNVATEPESYRGASRVLLIELRRLGLDRISYHALWIILTLCPLYHSTAQAQTPPKPSVISPGVTGVGGTIVVGPSITFRWNAVSGASRYQINWRIDPPSGQLFGQSVAAPATSFTTSLTVGSYYRWNMSALNGVSESPISDTLYFYVTANPPSNLSPGASSESQAPRLTTLTPTLSFSDVPNVDIYVVYISKKPYGEANIIHTGFVTSGSSYRVPNGVLALNSLYRWDVTSDPGDIEGPPSVDAYFKTPGPPNAPFSLAAVGASDYVSLAWSDGSDNEDDFAIQRQSVGSSSWDTIDEVNANILAYNDFTALPGISYNYQIIARNQYGSSPPSNPVQATRITLPNLVPSNVPGGNSPIILSKNPGSLTDDSSFALGQDLYAAIAVANIGPGSTLRGFVIQVVVNENLLQEINSPSLGVGSLFYQQNILVPKSRLQIGENYISITVDQGAVIAEQNELDNDFTKSFRIDTTPNIAVLNPNDGNALSACNSYAISWTTTGGDTASIAYFKFGFSLDGGNTFTDLNEEIPSSARSFSWTPHGLRSSQAYVRILAYNSSHQQIGRYDEVSGCPIRFAVSPDQIRGWKFKQFGGGKG